MIEELPERRSEVGGPFRYIYESAPLPKNFDSEIVKGREGYFS